MINTMTQCWVIESWKLSGTGEEYNNHKQGNCAGFQVSLCALFYTGCLFVEEGGREYEQRNHASLSVLLCALTNCFVSAHCLIM